MTLALPAVDPWDGIDWDPYELRVYQVFRRDFVDSRPTWRGVPVTIQVYPRAGEPIRAGREETFWHLVTKDGGTGNLEDRDRDPDRCARIGWIRPILEASTDDVRTWGQTRQGHQHYAVALPDFSYVVFVRDWGDHVQVKTAYVVAARGRRLDYEKEWRANIR